MRKQCQKCYRMYSGKKGDANICFDCLLKEQMKLKKEKERKIISQKVALS